MYSNESTGPQTKLQSFSVLVLGNFLVIMTQE